MKAQPITDTSDFFSIDCGDIIMVGSRCYKILGHERERRFGIEDPKFWVKRAQDIETGERKIIKLSYFESFDTTVGSAKIRCFRNPFKEAEILSFVDKHPDFMHGTSCVDEKGNSVRVLDIVHGPNFLVYIQTLKMGHELYFHTMLPGILKKVVRAFKAIRHLHRHGFRHGDIRNDHIIIDNRTGDYIWIDFDYDFEATENPFSLDLFGMGNILLCAAGKGIHTLFMIDNDPATYGDLIHRVEPGDFSILHKWRFINLKKLYSYIPESLNEILMHFSKHANVYYEYSDEIIDDLTRYIELSADS